MANAIGNAALVLSTDGGKLDEGLKQAEGTISKWAKKAGGLVKSALSSTVGAVADTIYKGISSPEKKLKEFNDIQKAADATGVSASQFAGFQKQLKIVDMEGDQVAKMFAKMGANIVAATDKAGGLTEELDGSMSVVDGAGKAQAFEKLGVSLDDLKGKSYDEQFKMIADGFTKIPKGAEQAALAIAVFGKSGASLLPVLQKGGAGIQEFIENQKRLGAVMSDEQYKAAADAQKAWSGAKKTIGAAWEGLTNKATLVAAPVVEFLGKGMAKAISFLTPVFQMLGEGLDTASIILGKVGKEAEIWIDGIVKQIQQLIQSSGMFGDSWVTAADVVKGAFLAVGIVIAGIFDIIKGVVAQMRLMIADILEFRLEVIAVTALMDNKGIQEANKNLAEHQANTAQLKRDRANAFEFNSAKAFQKWFLEQDFTRPPVKRDNVNVKPPVVAIDPASIKQVAAMVEGTQAAWDQEARFATRQLLEPQKIEQKNLQQLQMIRQLLERIAIGIGTGIWLAPG